MTRLVLPVLVLLGCGACTVSLEPPRAPAPETFTGGRELVDLAALARAHARAQAAPDDLDAQWMAAMAHVWGSLQGHVELRDRTEVLLLRAWRLDPLAERVPAARVLGRYLNLRSSVLDLEAIDLQIEAYASLAPVSGDPGEVAMDVFHLQSFGMAAQALAEYGRGRELRAFSTLRRLEREMDQRLDEHPDEIDTHAMVGNYELTFASVIPIAREERLARAIEHLEIQLAHWDELSPGARDQGMAPNVRSVFTLWLAEASLAAGRKHDAARAYRAVIDLEGQEPTRPRERMVGLARTRLTELEDSAGASELLPIWPAGVTSCVACHSREAELPESWWRP